MYPGTTLHLLCSPLRSWGPLFSKFQSVINCFPCSWLSRGRKSWWKRMWRPKVLYLKIVSTERQERFWYKMTSQGHSLTGLLLWDPIVCFHHLLTIPGSFESVSELVIGYVSIVMTKSHPQRPTSEHYTGSHAFGWLFIAFPPYQIPHFTVPPIMVHLTWVCWHMRMPVECWECRAKIILIR